MEVVPVIQWKSLISDLKKPMALILVYNVIILVIDIYTEMHFITIPITLLTVPGTVIGLLLAFRTNSSYDRWWEARKIWGQIVNDSRTLARQLTTYTDFEDGAENETGKIAKRITYRQIAWCYALCRGLRREAPWKELSDFLGKDEVEKLKESQNIPNSLLQTNAVEISRFVKGAKLDNYQYMQIDSTIRSLTDSMGKCERIKNTIFPVMYSRFLDLLIYIYILSLPFSLVDASVLILLPASLTLSFAFLAVDRIAFLLQDPFDGCTTDIPMYSLSRTIEINLKQQLGERMLPEQVKPVKGVLM